MAPTTSLQRSQRIQQIAQEHNAIPSVDLTVLSPPDRPPTLSVPDDDRKADAILGQMKIEESQNNTSRKSLMKNFAKSKKSSQYTYGDLYGALKRVVDENGLPGVLEVLLRRFLAVEGNINVAKRPSTSILHRRESQAYKLERGFLIQQATKQRRVPFVQLLAPHADQESLDQSLQFALQFKDQAIIELLLQYGANSARSEEVFVEAASSNNVELLSTLLRARHKVSQQCISRSLLPAAVNGYSTIVTLLVQAGADGDHDGASALMCAIRTSQVNIVASILTGENKSSGSSLDQALASVLSASPSIASSSHCLIELLLCAGPTGNAANEGLLKATQTSNIGLMQLFLSYDIDINYNGGAAIGHAIERNQSFLVETLLQNQILSPETSSELVSHIPRDANPMDRIAILSKLLVSGASGTNCNELLVLAVEQGDVETAQMLVTWGREQNGPPVCSVDYNGARCLQHALALNNLPMIQLLAFDGRPSAFSLSNAFSAIPPLNEEAKFHVAEILLRAGAKGPGVDEELHQAVASHQKSNRLIELLVQYGATILDETLLSVVSQALVDTVRILLSGSVSPSTCTAAIPVAINIPDLPSRYHTLKLLIVHAISGGVENTEISQAVINLLQKSPEDFHLLRLLCEEGKANINAHEGLTVELATMLDGCENLKTVCKSRGGAPSSATVARSLKCAMDLRSTDRCRRDKIEILLQGIKPQQGLDDALIQEIKSAATSNHDLGVIQVLLAAGADVNAREGAAVWGSISYPEIFDVLLWKHPNTISLAKASQQAMNLPEPARCIVCEKLWRAGVSGEVNSRSLLHVLKHETTSAIPLLQLLIPRADVNFRDGQALRIAVKNVFIEGLDLLLAARPTVPSAATKTVAFGEAMNIKSPEIRLDIVQRILAAGLSKLVISDGLMTATTSADVQLTTLLLKYGASTEHKGGQAIIHAAVCGHNDILKLHVGGELCAKPNASILTNAFANAVGAQTGDRATKYLVMKTLLEAGVRGDIVHTTLIEAVREGDVNLKFCELLHDHGASAEFNEGEAVYIATRSGHHETLGLLLRNQLPENILREAYVLVAHLPNQQRYPVIERLLKAGKSVDRHVINSLVHATQQTPPDRRLVKLLLSHDVFDEGQSMLHAASSQDMETLVLLVDTPNALPFISTAFGEVMKNDFHWKSTTGMDIMKLMLEKGASGDAVAEAVCKAAEKSVIAKEVLATGFLPVLLESGADVNYQQGRVLQWATQQMELNLVRMLLPRASAESKAMAIPILFLASDNAALVFKFLQAFMDSMEAGDEHVFASFEHPNPHLGLVLFMALEKFPRKPQIFAALLNIGYNTNQSRLSELDPGVGMEPDPILCWALGQADQKISSISIENLIEGGTNVNFQSKSGFTPLILAIQGQRSEIVSKLITAGANAKVPDRNGITPLAMASSLGNQEIMESLLQASAERDDGSLHDAARELRCESIRLLVKYGHQPDYPSERHDGRSALAELCYKAVDYNPKPVALEEAIQCLMAHEADIWLRCVARDRTARTMLHYALDSSNPMAILTVLLKLMWKRVNDESFLYKDDKYTYSLTKYVEKDVFRGPQSQKDRILHLLRNKRIIDKFWANDIEVEQPEDYCGVPAYIEEEVVRQKLRRKRLEERRQDTLAALELKRLTVAGEVEIMDIQTAAEIRWANEKGQSDLTRLQERANTQLKLEMQAEGQRDMLTAGRMIRERDHMKAIGDVQVSTQRSMNEVATEQERMKNMLQIEYMDTKIVKENEGVRARFAIEGQAKVDADKILAIQHEREKEMRGLKLNEDQARNIMQLDYLTQTNTKQYEATKARLQIEGAARKAEDHLEVRKHAREMESKTLQGEVLTKAFAVTEAVKGIQPMAQKRLGAILGEIPDGSDAGTVKKQFTITNVADWESL
ncbi:Serine/threonine-protein phosphatase 6 regulatory ankyrin repeat subunit B [Lachnellula suecica]|uniref:Serine/threonine-protein phosphatase 6 regulatory ankyrin repeat subunit B n=1 Tax=Lachnellula suecica TaxID=602035 RepID=A0A8T9CCC2_9HELO|nr:Serine/threonine-protein phosphatase 6 regulatory ankyrin repeat subunit B [Lachnellula suecica]